MKVSDHWVRSPLLNVNRACQICHPYPEAEIQARVGGDPGPHARAARARGDRATSTCSTRSWPRKKARRRPPSSLAPALALQRKAQWRLDFVAAENSMGFHAPGGGGAHPGRVDRLRAPGASSPRTPAPPPPRPRRSPRRASESTLRAVAFFQDPPALDNQYRGDRVLRSYLARTLPDDVRRAIEPALDEMGELAAGPLYQLQLADRLNEPVLTQWDAWGKRVDRIEVTPLWRKAARIAAEHGLVAIAYERAHGAHLARAPVGAGLPLRSVDRRLHLPAGDDRRRREDAARARQPRAHRSRGPAPDQPRSRPRLDVGPVDDRAHRRLRRRPDRDGRAPRTATRFA